MRKRVVTLITNYIKKYKDLDKDSEEVIIYGLESLYILITKVGMIFILAAILGIFKETFIFLLCFNGIRAFAFGLHATKSYICFIVSTIVCLALPYLASSITILQMYKIIIGVICTCLIFKNSPADTHKRPIVNPVKRKKFKIISTLISIFYVILSLFINSFISNCLLFSLIVESIITAPFTYKLFKLPYNNYIKYLEEEDENVFC